MLVGGKDAKTMSRRVSLWIFASLHPHSQAVRLCLPANSYGHVHTNGGEHDYMHPDGDNNNNKDVYLLDDLHQNDDEHGYLHKYYTAHTDSDKDSHMYKDMSANTQTALLSLSIRSMQVSGEEEACFVPSRTPR